jgi:CHAT domain-containing protein
LVERSGVYRAVQTRAWIGGNEVRAALPRGTALIDLVEFWHVKPPAEGQEEHSLEQRVVALVVRPEQTGVEAIPLGPSKDLAELIDRWRASYGAGKMPEAGTADPGAELRKRLWEPLAEHLRDVSVVLVSPDGPFNGLPLAALPGSKEGTFLVHEKAFATVPVPQLLPELLQAGVGPPADPASLVIGNIDFDVPPPRAGETRRDNHFAPLPGTEAEAAAIHEMFRAAFAGKLAGLLTGKDATKAAFVSRAPACSHLLVATHGFFLPEPEPEQGLPPRRLHSLEAILSHRDLVVSNPALQSGLVFAGANYGAVGQGDAFLTALEASDLDLARVDLAVLSACETGLGKVEGGEGVLGLQRAFQLAGARTAVTSLWKVPDATTQALMTRFHRNLWGNRKGKLEALREAQKWLIREAPAHPELLRGGLKRPDPKGQERGPLSPFYWAAFVLSGDWR